MSFELLENLTKIIIVDTNTLIKDHAELRYKDGIELGSIKEIIIWKHKEYLVTEHRGEDWILQIL